MVQSPVPRIPFPPGPAGATSVPSCSLSALPTECPSLVGPAALHPAPWGTEPSWLFEPLYLEPKELELHLPLETTPGPKPRGGSPAWGRDELSSASPFTDQMGVRKDSSGATEGQQGHRASQHRLGQEMLRSLQGWQPRARRRVQRPELHCTSRGQGQPELWHLSNTLVPERRAEAQWSGFALPLTTTSGSG